MDYEHTQRAPLHYILIGIAALLAGIAAAASDEPLVVAIVASVAGVFFVLALSFRSLEVFDDGQRLRVRFGPLPLFSTSINYAEITGVEAGQSSLIDGWGIHYVPGRGWLYNLWGFRCVVVHMGNKVVRVGTDDVDRLVAFLNSRIETPRPTLPPTS